MSSAFDHDTHDGPCSCGAWHKPGELRAGDAPRQPPRIDLPVSPEPAERDAVRTILAAIECEHIDPRDVYRELRPVLARLGKLAGDRLRSNVEECCPQGRLGRDLLNATRVLEREAARDQWKRARAYRRRGILRASLDRALMLDAWRLFRGAP